VGIRTGPTSITGGAPNVPCAAPRRARASAGRAGGAAWCPAGEPHRSCGPRGDGASRKPT